MLGIYCIEAPFAAHPTLNKAKGAFLCPAKGSWHCMWPFCSALQ